MKRFLAIYSLVATLLLAAGVAVIVALGDEAKRLERNQQSLLAQTTFYRTSLDESAASVQALELRCKEFREARHRDAEHIRRLGLRLRRVESSSKHATATALAVSAVLHDTVIVRDTVFVRDTLTPHGALPQLLDTLRRFAWHDAWCSVEGEIRGRDVECRITSRDTLHQIIHRVPRRFLFIRYGTKAIRQEIISSNPHTQIVYSEYIELPRRRRKR